MVLKFILIKVPNNNPSFPKKMKKFKWCLLLYCYQKPVILYITRQLWVHIFNLCNFWFEYKSIIRYFYKKFMRKQIWSLIPMLSRGITEVTCNNKYTSSVWMTKRQLLSVFQHTFKVRRKVREWLKSILL